MPTIPFLPSAHLLPFLYLKLIYKELSALIMSVPEISTNRRNGQKLSTLISKR
jgi:hypothetical protein